MCRDITIDEFFKKYFYQYVCYLDDLYEENHQAILKKYESEPFLIYEFFVDYLIYEVNIGYPDEFFCEYEISDERLINKLKYCLKKLNTYQRRTSA